MKAIKKNFHKKLDSLNKKSCEKKIKDSLIKKGKHDFSSYYYGGEDVNDELELIYKKKCAFCENNTTAGATIQVEHYRPKAKVTEDETHTGYYWLGYEWTNLLHACSKCNGNKANFFPIKKGGIRVTNPTLLGDGNLDRSSCSITHKDYENEKALILNPEIVNPRLHIKFLDNGRVIGTTEEGKTTIDKCDLNREPLEIARKNIVEELFFDVKWAVNELNNEVITQDALNSFIKKEVTKLLKKINNNDSFSELARTALINFDRFIIQRFGNKSDRVALNLALNKIDLSYL